MQARTTPAWPVVLRLSVALYAQPAVSPAAHAPTSVWIDSSSLQEESEQHVSSEPAHVPKTHLAHSLAGSRGVVHVHFCGMISSGGTPPVHATPHLDEAHARTVSSLGEIRREANAFAHACFSSRPHASSSPRIELPHAPSMIVSQLFR